MSEVVQAVTQVVGWNGIETFTEVLLMIMGDVVLAVLLVVAALADEALLPVIHQIIQAAYHEE